MFKVEHLKFGNKTKRIEIVGSGMLAKPRIILETAYCVLHYGAAVYEI